MKSNRNKNSNTHTDFHKKVLQTMEEGFVVQDTSGAIVDFNSSACRILGLSSEQLIGKTSANNYWKCVDENGHDYPAKDQPAMKVIENGNPIFDSKMGVRLPDKSYRWININALPIIDQETGELTHALTTFRDITKERSHYRIQVTLSEIRKKYIEYSKDERKFFEFLLEEINSFTESEYGFIGAIKLDTEGKRFLKTFAISDISWDKKTKELYDSNVSKGFEFRNLDSLFGAVISSGKHIIANAPKNHPSAGGLPEGHPDLNSFLGIPIYNSGNLIAMVGVANREAGYNEEFYEYLAPVMELVGEIIALYHLEAEANKNRSLLDLVSYSSELGIWSWNLEIDEIYFNDRWCLMLGYQPTELLKNVSTWEKLIHPEDLPMSLKAIDQYLKGKSKSYEMKFRMRHKDGHWVSILSKGKITEVGNDGKPKRLSGTHFDLTYIESLETVRDNVMTSLTNVIDNFPGPFWIKNTDHVVQLVNQAYADLYNQPRSNFIGKTDDLFLNSDLVANLRQAEEKIVATKRSQSINHEDHDKTVHRIFSFPLLDKNGEVDAIAGFNEDVTEQVALQKQLEYQNKILAHNAKLASIGELAAGVGHEINNPLAIAMGMLTLTRKEFDSETPNTAKAFDFMNKIDRALHRIKKIVLGLRTFSRSDSSELGNHPISDVAEETISLVSEIYQKDGISLSYFNTTGSTDLITGNKGRLQQVLLNLITNARDATQGRDSRQVSVIVQEEDEFLEIRVSDNGQGISQDLKQKIFDPFFTTKDVNEGTGIGLSLANNIVQEHKGQLIFETEEGTGTTFIVRLPKANTYTIPPHNDDDTKIDEKVPELHCNILLVDDEVDVLEYLKRTLEISGAQVTTCNTGKAGLAEVTNGNYDIVISDIKMPDLDGSELLSAVRQRTDIDQPKFFFMTGGVNFELEQKAAAPHSGLDGYFLKPIDSAQILDALDKLFGKKAA